MNNTLSTAKFIEKNGLRIVFLLALVMAGLVGLVFYFYAWQTITIASDSTSTPTNIKQTLLETIVKDLDTRANKLDDLNNNKLNTRDIFR